jgi:hypothetical protein
MNSSFGGYTGENPFEVVERPSEQVRKRRFHDQLQPPFPAHPPYFREAFDAPCQAILLLPDPVVILSSGMDDVEVAAEALEEIRGFAKVPQREPANPCVGVGQIDALAEGRVEGAHSQTESIRLLASSRESGRVFQVDVGARRRHFDRSKAVCRDGRQDLFDGLPVANPGGDADFPAHASLPSPETRSSPQRTRT